MIGTHTNKLIIFNYFFFCYTFVSRCKIFSLALQSSVNFLVLNSKIGLENLAANPDIWLFYKRHDKCSEFLFSILLAVLFDHSVT